ncbi:IgGFc-binding protein-like [Dermochelys coriacea]|uniref:IgGFc-binding protein-like n=1 Tax=Dermochelys coriacea TaxID=27794 RepID=UPI0018E749E9|nr:IgGFc-binding protein-like [Dermochelys coriacea]
MRGETQTVSQAHRLERRGCTLDSSDSGKNPGVLVESTAHELPRRCCGQERECDPELQNQGDTAVPEHPKHPDPCSGVQCRRGYQCIDKNGEPDCIPDFRTCNSVYCKEGTTCNIVHGWPRCIPNPPSCHHVKCKQGTVCKLQNGWPSCVPVPSSCQNTQCKKGTMCQVVDGWPKCVPVPSCQNTQCKEGTMCQVIDGWPKCVTMPSCQNTHCKEGTMCQVIDGWPKCIPVPSCQNIHCKEGTMCQVIDGWPKCVPVPSCQNTHCKEGTMCQVIDGWPKCVPVPSCQNTHCKEGTMCQVIDGWPKCVPVPSCQNTHCKKGTVCKEIDGWPKCVPVPSCQNTHCKEGTMCQVIDGWPKCVPVPSCQNTHCKKGTVCKDIDGWPKCVPVPSCQNTHCKKGTVCKEIDGWPKCVPVPSCQNTHCKKGTVCKEIDGWPKCIPVPSCQNTHCKEGTMCQVIDGWPKCVPVPSCQNTHCKKGTVCKEIDGWPKCVPVPSCQNTHCKKGTVCKEIDGWPKCVPVPPSCQNTHCKKGTVCKDIDGWPKCVPVPSCQNTHCKKGTVCKEIDGWPKCVPVPSCQNTYCKKGTVCKDIDGWPKCVPVPSCQNTHCKKGTVCKDIDGWPKCVPVPSCQNTHCKKGTVCHMIYGWPKCVPVPSCHDTLCKEGTVCQVIDGWPKCVPVPSCQNTHCKKGTMCQIIDGWPKCIPVPSCQNMHCKKGTVCQVVDSWPKCVTVPSCQNTHCKKGTVCKDIDGWPKCVPVPSCQNTNCKKGTVCQIIDGWPKCVPLPSCQNTHCKKGTVCKDIDGGPKCVPVPSCQNTHCKKGTVCQIVDGWPKCVPLPSCQNTHCKKGTFCSIGTMCQIIDGWPKCVPVPSCQNTHCKKGTVCKDTDGWPRCVPVPSCQNTHCEKGTFCSKVDGLPRCVPVPSCQNTQCKKGTVCKVEDGWPKCVSVPSCQNTHCKEGTLCQEEGGWPKCVPVPSCQNTRCKEGTMCKVDDGWPKCVHIPPSCKEIQCKDGTVCKMVNGWPNCLPVPCVPVPPSCLNFQCPPGTVCEIIHSWPNCVPVPSCHHFKCKEGTVCKLVNGQPECVHTPPACNGVHCKEGTVCKAIDGWPKCMRFFRAAPLSPPSCAETACKLGTVCQMVDGWPKCVPKKRSCEGIHCKPGTVCQMVDGWPKCMPKKPSCNGVHCKPGTLCQVVNGWPKCVPTHKSCDTVQCSKGMVCEVAGGWPQCVPASRSQPICWASGHPHYHTFDGHSFDFHGTCSYTVVKTCSHKPKLPAFHIITKSQKRGNTQVSFVSQVTIQVYHYNITMVKYEYGLARVNGQRTRLPISLHDGKLWLHQRGGQLVVEAEFGLKVYYDWNYYLVVKVTKAFLGRLCGLCGNYNWDPSDDFLTPSGHLATSAIEFGKSWKVEDGDRQCRHGCKGKCGGCSPELVRRYHGEAYCGLITKTAQNGPFRSCHALINPKAFLDDCVADLCTYDGYKQILCRVLKTYADACQREGTVVKDWRKQAGCPLPCPENSQYQLCGSACPSTCNDFATLDKCRLPCMETCQCKKGYMLDGGQCIPKGRCGCIHKGRLYTPGEHFWGDKKCQQKCQCNLHSRKVTCQISRCQQGEECRVANGIRSCYPTRYGTCSALGESHYITFDGLHYDFRGTCVYLLAGLCHKNSSLVKFQVLVQYQRKGSKSGSGTKVVEIQVYGVKLVIIHGKVRLNGLQINLPYNIDYDKISAYHRGWDIVVKTAFGLTVTFDGQNHIRVKVPATYGRSVCGLCGNFDGEDDNDMTMSNLLPAPTPSDFGRSWKARDIPGCKEMEKEDCMDIARVEKQHRKGKKECGLLLDRDGPFKKCHKKVNPEGYFKDCIFDRCSHKDNQTVVCHILACYAAACQAAGAKVYEWRTNKFCRPPCPQNSHYEMCSSSCPATCRSLYTPTRCPTKCREGCVCDEGFVLSSDQCVPLSQCGCVHRGFYYKPGETFYPNGFCKQRCSCQAGGIVECYHFSCGPNEECRVVDGIQRCHPVVPRTGTCHAAGDPHYLTFDGFPFDFQGNCTYVLAKSCVRKGYLPSFAIHVKNERLGRSKAAVTNTVSIIVYRRTFTLVRNRNGVVLVDGISYYLPFQLKNGLVRVYYHGANVVLHTKFGLHLSFDLNYYLAITVPKSYHSQTCGLCGNYNGKPHDDLLRPNGHLARDLRDLGVSWRVRVPGAVCDHGCASLVCPACQESRKASYIHNNYCGIIRAPYGPFSACFSTLNPTVFFNNCVHDLCKAGGNRRLMCRSIHSYVTACQAAGVKIKPWRTKKFCPMTCPANSHYKLCANPCSSGCKGVANITKCPKICAEGCQCNKGYFWGGNECVSIRHCHCFHKGRYYKPGARVLTSQCRQRCRCIPRGGVVCQSFQCPAGELCELSQGRWGCVRRDGNCTITRGDVFTSYDGVSGKVPLDGTYEISSLIDTRAASWFRVVVEFQTCKKCRAPRVTAITVYFHKLTILVNRNGRVLVNGRPVRLPARPSRVVSVSQAGNVVTVAQGSALQVLFSTRGDVTVRIDGKLARKVQAACGNYNGNSADDLRLPDGTVLDNIGEVLSYWRFSENPQDDYD